MLKRVQHDNRVRVSFFCHPELVSGSRFLVLRIWVLKPRPVGGALYFTRNPVEYHPACWLEEFMMIPTLGFSLEIRT